MQLLNRFVRKKSKVKIRGRIIAEVFGPDGELKQRSVSHNIVTDEGDALIADILQHTPERTKFDGTNGYIEVGTGWAGVDKTATSCVTPTGTPEVMDAGYPQTLGDWAAASDSTIVYKATYEAGDLNDTGIDEAAILNHVTAASADCLAYGQIIPSVNVGALDTLSVTWNLVFLGA